MLKLMEKWYLPLAFLVVCALKWPGAWLSYSQGKWIAVHFAGLAVTVLALARFPKLPRLKIGETVFLSGLILASFSHTIYFSPRGFEFTILDRWSFLFLTLGAWYGFRSGKLAWKDFWWPLAAALVVVSGIGLWQMWQVGFTGVMPYLTVGSTFGHTNNTAQFMGMALLLWWAIPRPRVPAWLMPLLSGFALTYFFFLRGRSTLIGFALGLIILVVLRYRREGKAFFQRRGIGAAALLVVLLFGGFQLARGKSFADLVQFQLLAEKSSMVKWRADVWRQTLEMIRAKPWGVGADRFTFEFIPFHARGETLTENGIADTPHNEILRYLAEDGVLLATLYFLTFGYVIFWWSKRDEDWFRFLPLFAFMAVEIVAQYAFNNPLPSVVLALLVGYMASRVWREELGIPRRPWVVGLTAAVLLLQLFFATKVVIARSFEHAETLEKATLSCRAVPRNWHSCLTQTRIELDRNDLRAARESAQDILFNDPWNFSAMRYLSIVAFRQGDRLEGCFYLWKYDHLFFDRSSIHDKLALNCPPKWLDYFRRKNPENYLPRYQEYQLKQKGSSLRFWE